MSAAEIFLLALAVGGSVFYLVRRAWRRFGSRQGGCCGHCPAAGAKIRLATRSRRESIGGPMRNVLLLLAAAAVPASTSASQLAPKQREEAQRLASLTVPSPAEFFAAVDKQGKPDWLSFHRAPGPTTFPTRERSAVNLGALVTDGYVAVEAQDGQQVKNTGKDIIALARALGVAEDVLVRGKSIADFADRNDWFALREELEATTNEVRRAMLAQRDEALASLITAGAWLRALEVGSRAAVLSGEEKTAALLSQAELVGWIRAQLGQLPEERRGQPVVAGADAALAAVAAAMEVPAGEELDERRVAAISAAAGQFTGQMAAREP